MHALQHWGYPRYMHVSQPFVRVYSCIAGHFTTAGCSWAVLRTFGYSDTLELAPAYARPPCPVPVDAVAEPSPSAISFLTRLFNQHDLEGADALEQQQLEQLFSTSPGIPWQRDVLDFATNSDHHTSLGQFLCLWR